MGQTENRIACGIIALCLQYFFLCAFVWMFFEGFQLYVMLIEVFEAEKSRVRWYYLIAYGLPLIIVGVSFAIFPHGYGTERYCWLKTDNYFIYSFVGPVIVVIIVSFFAMYTVSVFVCLAYFNVKVKVNRMVWFVRAFNLNMYLFQLNLVFLTMAIVMMCRHASTSVAMKNKEHSRLASTR